jgi:hypothetical protein
MISTNDCRRFVLPSIRQQCQQLDYSLFHLDGVNAPVRQPIPDPGNDFRNVSATVNGYTG